METFLDFQSYLSFGLVRERDHHLGRDCSLPYILRSTAATTPMTETIMAIEARKFPTTYLWLPALISDWSFNVWLRVFKTSFVLLKRSFVTSSLPVSVSTCTRRSAICLTTSRCCSCVTAMSVK